MYDAQAVMYRGTLYVGGGYTCHKCILYMYQFKPDTWRTTKTPTQGYALTVYQDHLLLAGGLLPRLSKATTNQLWLTENPPYLYSFKQTIPSMDTPTYGATAITTEEHLIIAGGNNEYGYLNTVQVYSGKQWALAQPLPVAAPYMKYAVLKDTLYLIGGYNQDNEVFYTSLPALLRSVHQSTPSLERTHRCPTGTLQHRRTPIKTCSHRW